MVLRLYNHVLPIPLGTHVLLVIAVVTILPTAEIRICTVTDTGVDMVTEIGLAMGIGTDIPTDTVRLIYMGTPTSIVTDPTRGTDMVMGGTTTKVDMVVTIPMVGPPQASRVGASESKTTNELHLCSSDGAIVVVSLVLLVLSFLS